MAKTKISEYDSTSANNTDVDSINIAEGCAPSGINNAIREVMAHLKDFQTGASGDSLTVGGNLSVTGTVTIPDNAISGDKVEGGTIDAITINTLSANPTLSAGTANGVAYLNGSKVLTSGSALTFNGSTLATTGALTVGGNTTLGDASTDTVTVNGYMGVGVAPSSAQGIKIGSTGLTSAFQYGIFSNVSGNSSATTFIAGVATSPTTEASAFTAPDVAGFRASTPTKGAGSTITNLHGLYIADQTQGTNNYGITSLVSSGTNKWNIYASGTAANYFAGSVGVGTNTFRTLNSDTPIFQIVGSGSSSSSAGLTRNSNDAGAPILYFGKTRGTTPVGTTAVSANDDAALLRFTASDGTDLIRTAQINVSVDGSVSTGVVPGRFVFSLANTSGALTERFKLSSSEAVFNDPGNDYDFRIESDTNSHAFFLEGSTGNVGIGTSSPTKKLHINAAGAGTITQALLQNSSAGTVELRLVPTAYPNDIGSTARWSAIQAINGGAGNPTSLAFLTNGVSSDPTENMRLDSAGNLGIGTSSPVAKLQVYGANVSGVGQFRVDSPDVSQITFAISNANQANWYSDGSQTVFGTSTATPLVLRTNSTERLRIDSAGNVGIGTTSYSAQLSVGVGSANAVLDYLNPSGTVVSAVTGQISTDTVHVFGQSGYTTGGAANTYLVLRPNHGSTGYGAGYYFQSYRTKSATAADDYLAIGRLVRSASGAATTTERLRIDAAGNLGLGVTPSGWNASWKALQVNGLALWGSNTGLTQHISSNAVFESGGYKYINTGFATDMYTDSGSYIWRTAPSGTAGAAISFTQAMTLDASGNLGVGTTSPGRIIDLGMTGNSSIVRMSANYNGSVTGLEGRLTAPGANRYVMGLYGQVVDNASGYQTVAHIRFYNESASPTTTSAPGYLTFSTTPSGSVTPTERARIDSSGRFMVGVTTALGAYLSVEALDDVNNCADFKVKTNGNNAVGFRNASSTRVGTINVSSASTAYNTSSDYRLKENIQPMTGALAKVAALKPCTYKWKADGSDGEGFIAHELAEVVPQCVTGEKDAVDADGNPAYQGIDTSFLVATLTAAIQEQQATIESLKARLDAANL